MMAPGRLLAAFLALSLVASANAVAQERQPPSPGDRCLAVASAPSPLVPVAEKLEKGEVRLTFVGHATFLIETAMGVMAATDYNDFIRPPVVPDVVTMNKAHTTHYSNFPDPKIKHVLKGWGTDGRPARHDLELGDLRVRNVPTNIRNFQGGTEYYANSIFIFEIAGLCIGHLGHLHHPLTSEHFAQIGQLDVLLVPVDGSYTMDISGMVEVVKQLHARLIIPMHYFNSSTLDRFLRRMEAEFPIDRSPVPTIVVSRKTFPPEPRVLVLPGD
jgi:L-ascorbate metabolism protein UlaG (beta-lactamase superfamily)